MESVNYHKECGVAQAVRKLRYGTFPAWNSGTDET